MSKLNEGKNNNKNNDDAHSNRKNLIAHTKKVMSRNRKKSKSNTNNTRNGSSFLAEFKHSKSGIAGVFILLLLISMTLYAFFGIPLTSIKEWNKPNYWIDNPRLASPIWSNFGGFFGEKTPEHIVLSSTTADNDKYVNNNENKITISNTNENGIKVVTHSYNINYDYDLSPNDFMITYSLYKKEVPPAIEIEVLRPDKHKFDIYFNSITPSIS